MASADNITCSDNTNPQFVIIFLHWLACEDPAKPVRLRCELTLTAKNSCAFNHADDWIKRSLLTCRRKDGRLRGFFQNMKVCHITGSRTRRGSVIHRRGLAKKKGGVGRHITKMVPRMFVPNLQHQRIWVPELKKFVRIRVTARGMKTINKHGAYKALKKAGAI
jgi:large subunit ribosomal protein L28